MTAPAKVLVIGIDSGDRGLIANWAAEGHLPTFAKLIDGSMTGQVDNPHGLEAGSAWPTFHTGVTPAKHGQYEGMRVFDPELYDHRILRTDEMSRHYFWRHLEKNGKRFCLIDPEYMRMPDEDFNGTIIADLSAHAPCDGGTSLNFQTKPPELAVEIEKKYGTDPLEGVMCDNHKPRTLEEQRWFRDSLVERTRRKAEIAVDQLALGGWDFFEVVFADTHCAGHHSWHLHDRTHPEFDPAIADALGGDPLRDVYVATDKAIARIMDAAGPETKIIVYCSHGIGAEYSGTRMLDRILVALEGKEPVNYRSPALNTARAAWRGLPKGMRRALKPVQRRAWTSMMTDGFQPDRRNRRFFEVYLNNRSAGVRINLKGREPEGVVEPGDEYDSLVGELIDDLLSFTNTESGEPLVEECVAVAKEYAGELLDTLPDVSVTWNTKHPIRKSSSPKTGEVINEQLSGRSGDHRPIGQFFAVGPDIEPRLFNQPVQAVDFVPTFAAMLGIPLPETDGSPIELLAASASSVAAE